MSLSAAYLVAGEQRDNYDYTPEASRRARGFTLYAALRSLGRRGVAELIERNCAQAALFAGLLRAGGAEILNDVVLNQVLVAARRARSRADPGRRHLLGRRDVWRDRPALRISVSNWATTDADIERSAAAILAPSGDQALIPQIAEDAQEHRLGVDVLVEAEAARLRAVGEHVVVPGEDEVAEAPGGHVLVRGAAPARASRPSRSRAAPCRP